MASQLNPYISFKDNAREAMEFYKDVFGGELTLSTMGEGMPGGDPADAEKIMHAQLTTPGGMALMAADTPSSMTYEDGSRISISLSGENDAELSDWFAKLAGEGRVIMPLEKAPWGDKFGMCADQFGVNWMVNIAGSAAES